MKDNNIVIDNAETEDTGRIITSLETAKELRFILPYCRQISAFKRYLRNYVKGDFGGTPGYVLMIDSMAKQFGVKTYAWLIFRINYENNERFGMPLALEDIPACLRIDTGNGRSIEDVCTQLTAEEDHLLGLKNKALYIAAQKEELQYEKTGYDPVGENFWDIVTWKKRGFLIPATEETIAKCREEGSPELPSYMTTRPPISPYRRSSALQSSCIVEKYINQNSTYLQGFEKWMVERYKKEN